MNLWLVCHLVMCFLLVGSVIIGLTRKDAKQLNTWHWITRICSLCMIVSGCVLAFSTFNAAVLNTICKLVLSCASICFIEFAYKRKKAGKLERRSIYLLAALIVLTIICGFILAYTTGGSFI